MIRVENVWKSIGNQEVLRGVSFEVQRGEFVALIGSSGGGKSVLLKLLVGLLKPDRGRIWVAGKDVAALNRRELESLRSRLGFVFQGGALFDSMTVYNNVAFPLREKASLGEKEIYRKVISELELVGLRAAVRKYPAELSGGMLKRVALARALVRDPEIVLFDEPTTGLDPVVSRAVLDVFGAVHERLKLTGILVSHEIPRIFEISQKVAMLHEGRIIAFQPPDRLCTSPEPAVQQFVNGISAAKHCHAERVAGLT